MVLRRDLHAAGEQVHHGVVAAAVAELELLDGGAGGLRDHLVPEADAEHGHLAQDLLHLRVGALHGLGVAGTVGQEHAVGGHGQHLFRRRVPRHDRELAARAHEVLQDGALRAAVVGDHAVARGNGGRDGERMARRQVACAHGVRLLARHRGGEVLPHEGLARAHLAQKARLVHVDGGEHGTLGAAIAHVAHERAGVHALHGHHAVIAQVVGQAQDAAPVRRRRAHIAHHQAAQRRLARLGVIGIHAVVADLRIRHGDDLTGVRRVGHHLKVALERRVEADLAVHLAFGGA